MDVFRNRVAMITGGASGIGLALGRALAAEGARVELVDRDSDRLREACATVPGAWGNTADVADPSAVGHAVRDIVSRRGGLHLVCANAGILGPSGERLWEVSDRDWRRTFDVNLFGVINTLRATVPHLLAEPEAHVVITGSMASVTSESVLPAYWASKHALMSLAETLSSQLACLGNGVGVSFLLPGRVDTGLQDGRSDIRVFDAADHRAQGRSIGAMQVADATLAAVKGGDFYVVTHPEAIDRVKDRLGPLLRAFVDATGETS